MHLEAWALAGSDVVPEFQISVVDGEEKRVVRPYSTDPTFVYPTEGNGSVKFYVEARTLVVGIVILPFDWRT